MQLNELFDKCSFSDIWPVFVKEYPDQGTNRKGYEKAYTEMRKKRPVHSSMILVIEHVKDDDWEYEDVSGLENGEKWGLDFTAWSEMLGIAISEDTLKKYDEKQIVAHCLYEMTFHGYTDKEVQKKGEDMLKRAEKARKDFHKLPGRDELK